MTKEEWFSLKDGDIVTNEIDGDMEVFWTGIFNEYAERELCLVDKSNVIWNGWQFDWEDWQVKERRNHDRI